MVRFKAWMRHNLNNTRGISFLGRRFWQMCRLWHCSYCSYGWNCCWPGTFMCNDICSVEQMSLRIKVPGSRQDHMCTRSASLTAGVVEYDRLHITVTSWWARWHLKSPALTLFAQLFVQTQIKETSKVLVTGLCEGNSPVPAQRANKAENVSISWHHHEKEPSTISGGSIRNHQFVPWTGYKTSFRKREN